jgi:hypothetical protein
MQVKSLFLLCPAPGSLMTHIQEDLGMSFAVLRHIRDQFKVGHGVRWNRIKRDETMLALDALGIDVCRVIMCY